MPAIDIKPQPYMQALGQATGSPTSHIADGKILGLYFHKAVPWPHGMIMIAHGQKDNWALLAHEMAHHVLYWADGDWRNEQHANWVQHMVKRGACDDDT